MMKPQLSLDIRVGEAQQPHLLHIPRYIMNYKNLNSHLLNGKRACN